MPKTTVKSPQKSKDEVIKELEKKLQEIESRIEYTQYTGKLGSFEWDIKNNTGSWTKGFAAIYGNPKGHEKFKHLSDWMKFVHPDDRERTLAENRKALKDQTELSVEFRVIWPNKTTRHIITRASISRDEKGKAMYMVGINIDITERKQIEGNFEYLSKASKVLASSIDYRETLATVAKLGVPEIADWCTVDMLTDDGKIKQLALAHKDPKMIKWAQELNKKSPPPDMNAPTGVPHVIRTGKSEFYPIITDAMLVASAENEEQLALLRKLHLTSIIISPLIVQGKVVGVITFLSTESERYYNQSDLIMAEEVAARASLAIEHARLYREAKKAVSLRDEFISIASHELKTPVTSLKMYTQITHKQLESKGETTLLTPLTKMNAQIDRLNLLISDLLNVSKIQLGKLEFNETHFNLQELVEETAEAIQPSTHKHTITVKGKLTKKVWGDRDRIGQVITNLLSNAVKYSPQADKIIIKLREDKECAHVSVLDFGIGIDKEHQKKIFDRFYRVTDPNEKTFPGLGIGLYITSEIVKRHGGSVEVKSTKGKGSEFSFCIPFKK